jgi:hypothetical protein
VLARASGRRGRPAADSAGRRGGPRHRPQAPQQGEHLLQERAALDFGDVLGHHLRSVGLAQDHDQQQPPAAEPVEIGERPGQPHRVTPGHDHVGAEFQPCGAGGGVAQADEGIEGAVEHPLGQPERIEPQPFKVIHEPGEVVERQVRLASTREPEADLHGHPSVAALWQDVDGGIIEGPPRANRWTAAMPRLVTRLWSSHGLPLRHTVNVASTADQPRMMVA